jgi:radical SAM superfamily enzyme
VSESIDYGVREYLRKVYALYIRGGVSCALENVNCHAKCLFCSVTVVSREAALVLKLCKSGVIEVQK